MITMRRFIYTVLIILTTGLAFAAGEGKKEPNKVFRCDAN